MKEKIYLKTRSKVRVNWNQKRKITITMTKNEKRNEIDRIIKQRNLRILRVNESIVLSHENWSNLRNKLFQWIKRIWMLCINYEFAANEIFTSLFWLLKFITSLLLYHVESWKQCCYYFLKCKKMFLICCEYCVLMFININSIETFLRFDKDTKYWLKWF